jgi:hypothetical protein
MGMGCEAHAALKSSIANRPDRTVIGVDDSIADPDRALARFRATRSVVKPRFACVVTNWRGVRDRDAGPAAENGSA